MSIACYHFYLKFCSVSFSCRREEGAALFGRAGMILIPGGCAPTSYSGKGPVSSGLTAAETIIASASSGTGTISASSASLTWSAENPIQQEHTGKLRKGPDFRLFALTNVQHIAFRPFLNRNAPLLKLIFVFSVFMTQPPSYLSPAKLTRIFVLRMCSHYEGGYHILHSVFFDCQIGLSYRMADRGICCRSGPYYSTKKVQPPGATVTVPADTLTGESSGRASSSPRTRGLPFSVITAARMFPS